MVQVVTFERAAISAMGAICAWIAISVQGLTVDVAVLKTQAFDTAFPTKVETRLDNHQVWLGRLSDRINALETKEEFN
jgi:hypothetical protein